MLEIQNVHKTFNLGTINEKIALNGGSNRVISDQQHKPAICTNVQEPADDHGKQ